MIQKMYLNGKRVIRPLLILERFVLGLKCLEVTRRRSALELHLNSKFNY